MNDNVMRLECTGDKLSMSCNDVVRCRCDCYIPPRYESIRLISLFAIRYHLCIAFITTDYYIVYLVVCVQGFHWIYYYVVCKISSNLILIQYSLEYIMMDM